MTRTIKALIGAALLALALVFAACGGDDEESSGGGGGGKSAKGTKLTAIEKNPDNSGKRITVGSKNFTEEFILGEIYAQGLEAAGYTVKKQLNLGSEQIAHRALKRGQVDAYPEYTGTALTSFFGVKIPDVPKDEQAAYELTKKDYAKEGLAALPPTPFTDSEAVGFTKPVAEKYGVKKISELKPIDKDIVFAGAPECKQREDCLLGLQKTYGLKFKKFIPVDIAQRYEAGDSGQAQLIEIFTTDGQLASGKYVVLEDDKKLFPPYNATLVVRDEKLKELGPDVQAVVEKVQKGLTVEVMQELNSRVDIDKKEPEQVAGEYLKETGLVK